MTKSKNYFYYNLSGGLNSTLTHTSLGQNVKRLCWSDSYNVEIYKNQGVARQAGNQEIFDIKKEVIALCEYPKGSSDFVFATKDGEIYHYTNKTETAKLIKNYGIQITSLNFLNFLGGIIIAPKNSPAFFYNTELETVVPLGLTDSEGHDITSDVVGVFANRVWLASGDTLYFSALGTYDDWTSEHDAGYISKFHSSTSKIVALSCYAGNLAIYKNDEVYLLSGSNPDEFSVIKFADKGTLSANSVVSADNKQYFLTADGVFSLEQAGILSQISLSGNIAKNVQSEFEQINYKKIAKNLALPYEKKNQVWFFTSFKDEGIINDILIYDYSLNAWSKRVIPFEIAGGAVVSGEIYTYSTEGKIYRENIGNSFSTLPIKFRFSTPFFTFGSPSTTKIIEDFNFILDENRENNFKFSVSKDFATSEIEDVEQVNQLNPKTLVWVDDSAKDEFNSVWSGDENFDFNWAENVESKFKTEIFDANNAVQIHATGENLGDDFAIIALEFKEILFDD